MEEKIVPVKSGEIFGSTQWQERVKREIKEKIERGEGLTPGEIVFVATQTEHEKDIKTNFAMTREKAIKIGDSCLEHYSPHLSHEEAEKSEALSFLITHAEKCSSCEELGAVISILKQGIDEYDNKKIKTDMDYIELQTMRWMYDLLTKEDK